VGDPDLQCFTRSFPRGDQSRRSRRSPLRSANHAIVDEKSARIAITETGHDRPRSQITVNPTGIPSPSEKGPAHGGVFFRPP
jgi:hypothetical protein